ncbi:MAG TPA: S41 family peptidase [bacterium]|nr:S41 family peptidase [bacterium]
MIRRNRLIAASLVAALVSAAFFVGYAYGQRSVPFAAAQPGQAAGSARTEGIRLLEALSNRVTSSFITKGIDERTLYLGAAKGMLESLGDPYTRFMEPRAFSEFKQDARGFFFGVGIFIDIRDRHLIVVQPIKGTPAARAGLRAGDWITKIDGLSTDGMAIQEAVVRIRGPRGTTVKLSIHRGTRDFEATIVRDRIEIVTGEGPDSLDAASRAALRQAGIGYVKLITFNDATARTFDRLFDEARRAGARALILDLRGNGGGLLDVSLEVANRFVRSGQALVLTVNRDGRRTTERATSGPKITMPVVVLVNEFTASASEIVSGALEDNGVATLVGVKTFGKGVIQTIFDLPMDSGAAITTAKYLTPNGRDIHGRGLTPQVGVGETEEVLRERLRGKSDDEVDQALERMRAEQLRRAIEVLKQKMTR